MGFEDRYRTFFDEIDRKILRRILEKDIKEEDMIFLIEENTKSIMLEDSGELAYSG